MDGEAILVAIRDVITAGGGVARQIDVGRFRSGTHDGQADEAIAPRALVAPRVDVVVGVGQADPSGPQAPCNQMLLTFPVTIKTTRHMRGIHKLDETKRDAVVGQAMSDQSDIIGALIYPGNVNVDGVVSKCLKLVSVDTPAIILDNGRAARIETTARFLGWIKETYD